MKKFFILFLAISVSLVAFSCSKIEQEINTEDPAQAEEMKPSGYVLSIQASKTTNEETKALILDGTGRIITPSWNAGETVDVYHGDDLVGTLTAQGTGASVELSGTLDSSYTPASSDVLTLKFCSPDYRQQDGTLEYIATHCDYSTASITVDNISGNTVNVSGDATFTSHQSITKFTFSVPVHFVMISADGLEGDAIGIETQKVAGEYPTSVYVAMHNNTGVQKIYTIIAADDTRTYYKTKRVKMVDGKFYSASITFDSTEPATKIGNPSTGYTAAQPFNAMIKKAANGGNPTYNTSDTKITRIVLERSARVTDYQITGASTSSCPSYASWDEATGTITLSTIDTKFRLNYDCSYLFSHLEAFTGEIENMDLFDNSELRVLKYGFQYCHALSSFDFGHFDTSTVTGMGYLFSYCNWTGIDVSELNTSNVSGFAGMFFYCRNLTSLDLSNLDTRNATDMAQMFYWCDKLATLTTGPNFQSSKVQYMQNMFDNCKVLTSIDLSHFDTAKVLNMEAMFRECNAMTTLTLGSGFTASSNNNQYGLRYMFQNCSKLTALDLSHFATPKAKSMQEMFSGCNNLVYLDLSDEFSAANVTSMYKMFYNCKKLKGCTPVGTDPSVLNLSSFASLTYVTTMESMFEWCQALTNITFPTAEATYLTTTARMFLRCDHLESLTINGLTTTSRLTDTNCMFYYCAALTDISLNLTTSSVTSMESMFGQCSSLTSLGLSQISTESVNSFNNMFNGCTHLANLYLGDHFKVKTSATVTYVINELGSATSGATISFKSLGGSDTAYRNLKTAFLNSSSANYNISDWTER